jgi:hypothetical protein
MASWAESAATDLGGDAELAEIAALLNQYAGQLAE